MNQLLTQYLPGEECNNSEFKTYQIFNNSLSDLFLCKIYLIIIQIK